MAVMKVIVKNSPNELGKPKTINTRQMKKVQTTHTKLARQMKKKINKSCNYNTPNAAHCLPHDVPHLNGFVA